MSAEDENNSAISGKAKPEWEIERHLENYRFFFDLGLKAVGLFFAIVGGMLSIIGRDTAPNKEIVKFLFVASFIMSVILFFSFLVGAWFWRDAVNKIKGTAELKMRKAPDFVLLTWLLCIFGGAILVTGISLLFLLDRLF